MNDFLELVNVLAPALGMTPDQLLGQIAARKARAERQAQRASARYTDALHHITVEQAAQIELLRSEHSARMQSGIRQHRVSENVVVFMQAQKWNAAVGRMGTKLYAVYPDGSRSETFERSISVRRDF